jgi:hypothetical protein
MVDHASYDVCLIGIIINTNIGTATPINNSVNELLQAMCHFSKKYQIISIHIIKNVSLISSLGTYPKRRTLNMRIRGMPNWSEFARSWSEFSSLFSRVFHINREQSGTNREPRGDPVALSVSLALLSLWCLGTPGIRSTTSLT